LDEIDAVVEAASVYRLLPTTTKNISADLIVDQDPRALAFIGA
jgi:hypothetical protein